METTLHRQLKERYGPEAGGRSEVSWRGFRIDAVAADGALVEVQSGPLAHLRTKLGRLLPEHRVRVVKPVVVRRRVVSRARNGGEVRSARLSPKRGALVDVFDDLIGLARVFPDPNLWVELLAVEIDEIRSPRRRRPGYSVDDRALRSIVGAHTLREPRDLLALLPADLPAEFSTRELAERLGRPQPFAQRVAYCLRLAGAVDTVGKAGNRRIYRTPHAATALAS